ncbi:poly [ADP-ribose] polymerase 1 [Selaginella moellendorffii]|uniref:poly [ADP-ribose] polymerase 1 n=1 Tax=Selaginella moellendorffii TaxID=88036 RepID=UPI000D1C4BE6|nr:poly [ADP-ribose] polymerase 1 [Selaginella moellendorffii]|eukprot:XP_024534740.1 poly [ADP-ribose] polymerase 1 [Selaginella moellendorffii]
MEPDHPWRAEYAKSSRAACGACHDKIDKDELRLGRMVESPKFDGWIPVWHHYSCIARKKNTISSIEDVDGFDNLRWGDQKKLRKYIEGDEAGALEDNEEEVEEAAAPAEDLPSKSKKKGTKEKGKQKIEQEEETSSFEHTIEIAKASRAICRVCKEKLVKGEARISTVENEKYRSPTFRHAKCFVEFFSWDQPIEELDGWDTLDESEQKVVHDAVEPFLKLTQENKEEIKEEKEEEQEKLQEEKKAKRQLEASGDDQSSKKKQKVSDDFEKKMEQQTKALWTLQDDLERNVSLDEMKEMLEINNGAMSKSDKEIRERCADGMMFGPFKPCPQCGGPLLYSGGMYSCQGHLSEWSRCNFKTSEVQRQAKWKIPKGSTNPFLRQWNKTQKTPKEPRLLRPSTKNLNSEAHFLRGLHVFFFGAMQEKTQDEWKALIEEAKGVVHKTMDPGVTAIISTEAEFFKDESLRQLRIPAVGERYLTECMKMKKRLPLKDYRLESSRTSTAMTKVKVKGRSAVHEDSEMQDKGHVLESGSVIYSVTLNKSDISTGRNSCYVLQIIEEDKGNACYVFRKWGRVASERGHTKLEAFSKQGAIEEFEKGFLDKTGNEWHSWVRKTGFQKVPGKYYPVEIDYGADEAPQKELAAVPGSKSNLHPRVVNLMKMLFDIETYKSAMLEFEINPNEMPLGKLTKAHIAKGFDVLTRIQNVLKREQQDPRRQVELIDGSNQFNTLIPSTHPTLIDDEDVLKTKIQMLEALRDIEIASQLIKSADEDDESDPLDVHYKKLKCAVSPVPHDSPEFELVKNYLERTHAPTHTEWGLEVEDVFVVSRDGEHDLYAPMKSTLKNRMLLWHGSRTTNFVGILSQGLRIAPPEAPATGYMFGKGVYFADLVSKSAQYCFTNRSNPVGLMLLSEVALGDIKEYTHAQYMEKPPAGYMATKGVGRTMPDPSEFKEFDDGVVVPCGRPVPSQVRSDLLYNEFIVYSTSQIQLRFLLKVRFKYKR